MPEEVVIVTKEELTNILGDLLYASYGVFI